VEEAERIIEEKLEGRQDSGLMERTTRIT